MPGSPCPSKAPLLQRRQLLIGAVATPLAVATLSGSGMTRAADAGLNASLRERVKRDAVGMAAVQVSPAGVELYTVGVMRQGGAAPITAQSVFELGSMTKAFVALWLADGVLNRRWAFEDAVEDALPAGLRLRDANGEPLRLIDLATHRSGLPRMPANLSAKELADPYGQYDEQRLFAFLRDWQPGVGRGARFEYSNLGYGVLAQVLARREGVSLDAALASRVFRPLGLDGLRIRRPLPAGNDLGELSAALGASFALASREAIGHSSERKPVPSWQFDAMAGAVGLVGSIETVGRFIEAALGLVEHPLGQAFALCLQKRGEGEHPLHPFALAWEMSPLVTRASSRMLFNQDGATAGFSSSLWIEPARRRGAAVLSNTFIETRALGLKALDPTIRDDDFALMQLPAEAVAPLVGSYSPDGRFGLELRLRDGRLWAQGSGEPEFELLPSTPRRFFTRHSHLEVLFDDSARPTGLIVLRDGKGLPFHRQL